MMTTRGTALHPAQLSNMKKPITALSVLVIAALTLGVAVAERMEQRASEDRLSIGDVADQS